MSATPPELRWWLLEGTTPQGPYGNAYVQLRLEDGTLSPETLACLDGNEAWRPLRDWLGITAESQHSSPPRLGLNQSQSPSPVNRRPHSAGDLIFGLATSDLLEATRIYAMYLSPIIFFASKLSCIATPPTFVAQSTYFGLELLGDLAELAVSLFVVILLFAGGMKLKHGERSGVTLLLVGFCVNFATVVASIVYMIALSAAAQFDTNVDHFSPHSQSFAEVVYYTVMLCVFLAAAVFQTAVGIWLWCSYRSLPLRG